MYGIYQYLARVPTIHFVLLTLYLFCMVRAQMPKGINIFVFSYRKCSWFPFFSSDWGVYLSSFSTCRNLSRKIST